ncbi:MULTISPECIES: hypothetical protein [unclassified Mycobacterium]|uniref:hypothetical protein n=1 Tax=unclassified Mycobacterium TaxID=2642494 RepID=UPI0029C6D63D|nr:MULTISPECIES: hypothetical protein [unclassified Mycobacterium]
MNTTTSRGLVRFIAGPVAAASIIGGALGLAAVANASTAPTPAVAASTAPTVGPATNAKATDGGESTNAGGLMQATNAGGLMQATTPTAVAAAAPDAASCTQWGFNGTTSLSMGNGGTMFFNAKGASLGQPGVPTTPAEVTQIVGNQGTVLFNGFVTGGIAGDQIAVTFASPQTGGIQLTGQVSPDGSARGTGSNGAWKMNPQLKCV